MDAGRYLSTNPGHWIFLDSFAKGTQSDLSVTELVSRPCDA
jgi:hypothetical protein